jgi:dienelactone hydrolase
MTGYQPGGVPPGLIDWAATTTHSDLDAPAEPHRRHRVVLYSPGAGDPRGLGTVLAEELASWGYLVISIDHTYETYVEFPGGRLVGPELLAQAPPPDAPDAALAAFLRKLVGVRVADARFVLDRLDDIGSQVGAPIDTGRVGMVGHSAGGFTALQAAYDDCRLRAAADLDGELNFGHEDLAGTPMSTVAERGLDRPFLLIGSKSGGHRDPQNASWGLLWRASRGWRRDLYLRDAAHASFTDLEPLVGRLAACGGIDAATRGQVIGTVPATEAVGANRSAVRSFFDTTLRGRPDGLLDKPQRRFPDLIRRG